MTLARGHLLATMEDLVGQRARDRGAWLVDTLRNAEEPDAFAQAFSEASRRTSRSALALLPEDAGRLHALGITWSLTRWALDDLARTALLLRAGEALAPAAFEAVA